MRGKRLAFAVILGVAALWVALTVVAVVTQFQVPAPTRLLLALTTLGLGLGVLVLVVRHAQRTEIDGGAVGGAALFAIVTIFLVDVWSAPIFHAIAHRGPREGRQIVGDLRTLVTMHAAYQSSNGGFFDWPECLVAPSRCLPVSPSHPRFLEPALGGRSFERGSYHIVFHAGPEAERAAIQRAGASRTSLLGYAYTAQPREGGRPSFCAEASGRICQDLAAKPFEVVDGECPKDCSLVQ